MSVYIISRLAGDSHVLAKTQHRLRLTNSLAGTNGYNNSKSKYGTRIIVKRYTFWEIHTRVIAIC